MEKNVKLLFEHLLERVHGPAWKVKEPEIALLLKRTGTFEPPTLQEVEDYLKVFSNFEFHCLFLY